MTTTQYVIQRNETGSYYVRSNGMNGGAVWTGDEAGAARFPTQDAADYVVRAYRNEDRWTVRQATR